LGIQGRGCDVGKYYDELFELWLKPAGDAGWELIHISERPGDTSDTLHLKAYFKRPAAVLKSTNTGGMTSSIAAQIEGGGYPRTD
jgi:hypothetical protein